MQRDYTELDNAILARLAKGPATFHLLSSAVEPVANRHATPDRYGQRVGWRVVDRRLQALRKAGKVAIDRKFGWSKL